MIMIVKLYKQFQSMPVPTSVVVQPPHVDDALLLLSSEQSDVVEDLLGQRVARRVRVQVLARSLLLRLAEPEPALLADVVRRRVAERAARRVPLQGGRAGRRALRAASCMDAELISERSTLIVCSVGNVHRSCTGRRVVSQIERAVSGLDARHRVQCNTHRIATHARRARLWTIEFYLAKRSEARDGSLALALHKIRYRQQIERESVF